MPNPPIALITGASRGIGAATALAMAKAGYHCVLTARTVGGLEETDDAIRAIGGSATIVPLDLRQLPMIDSLAAQIYERFGKLDALIGNAGMLGNLTPIAHHDTNEWEDVFRINVHANARLLRACDPLLKRSEHPRVVMVTSSAARHAIAYWGAYAASKAALEQLTLIYAAEVASTTIRVNLLDPGGTRTRMRAKAFPSEDTSRLHTPEMVADTIVNLCTENAPHGTHSRVNVNVA